MKKTVFAAVMATGLLAAATGQAYQINETIDDTYIGQYDYDVSTDVVADESLYDITSMDVNLDTTAQTLQVTVHAGEGDYFVNWNSQDVTGFGPGSLFLSTDGWDANPTGSSSFDSSTDVYQPGDWNYAVTVSGAYNGSSGATDLFDITDDQVRIHKGVERDTVEAWYNPIDENGIVTNTALTTGTWELVQDVDGLTAMQINITLTDDFIAALGDNPLGLSWTQICSNDVIQGAVGGGTSDVPEPATMALFGIGLAALAGGLRRRQRRNG